MDEYYSIVSVKNVCFVVLLYSGSTSLAWIWSQLERNRIPWIKWKKFILTLHSNQPHSTLRRLFTLTLERRILSLLQVQEIHNIILFFGKSLVCSYYSISLRVPLYVKFKSKGGPKYRLAHRVIHKASFTFMLTISSREEKRVTNPKVQKLPTSTWLRSSTLWEKQVVQQMSWQRGRQNYLYTEGWLEMRNRRETRQRWKLSRWSTNKG